MTFFLEGALVIILAAIIGIGIKTLMSKEFVVDGKKLDFADLETFKRSLDLAFHLDPLSREIFILEHLEELITAANAKTGPGQAAKIATMLSRQKIERPARKLLEEAVTAGRLDLIKRLLRLCQPHEIKEQIFAAWGRNQAEVMQVLSEALNLPWPPPSLAGQSVDMSDI